MSPGKGWGQWVSSGGGAEPWVVPCGVLPRGKFGQWVPSEQGSGAMGGSQGSRAEGFTPEGEWEGECAPWRERSHEGIPEGAVLWGDPLMGIGRRGQEPWGIPLGDQR